MAIRSNDSFCTWLGLINKKGMYIGAYYFATYIWPKISTRFAKLTEMPKQLKYINYIATCSQALSTVIK